MRHLADLGILSSNRAGEWDVPGAEPTKGKERFEEILLEKIRSCGQSERGFALSCFFPEVEGLPDSPVLEALGSFNTPSNRTHLFGKKGPSGGMTSDPSNLQIVRKMEKQLKPFLDLEKEWVARLQGTHVSREDAKRLFHYIVGRSSFKVPPRKWEQLSRRRHK
ncbi:MAG: hypothetical protein COV67_03165 [Nitrospinae bacterium CG11_big_fil_rev_8_21_14_0_20_56_8]|nr:MAG: hypothetical protein COV67_03165 [Nitrospinae bacterium CG11_big_fil_rev_8_21_14_0_20_56_8]